VPGLFLLLLSILLIVGSALLTVVISLVPLKPNFLLAHLDVRQLTYSPSNPKTLPSSFFLPTSPPSPCHHSIPSPPASTPFLSPALPTTINPCGLDISIILSLCSTCSVKTQCLLRPLLVPTFCCIVNVKRALIMNAHEKS
jgi:hypothetical protein